MRKMPEIKAENGFVTSIDGNAIPRTKLYRHYINFISSGGDFAYTFFDDDYPNSYKETPLRERYANTSLPLYGLKVSSGFVCHYTSVYITMNSIREYYVYANLEKNEVITSSDASFGAFIRSDTVTPIN